MKPNSILINTARGKVIESLDLLYQELESNRLAAVGLDVFPEEPANPSHPLFNHPRAFCTGHVAARSPHSQRRILKTMIRETCAILQGDQPNLENIVNPEVLTD
jgi:phosphoglycerate dehydrogenase-like enzyme